MNYQHDYYFPFPSHSLVFRSSEMSFKSLLKPHQVKSTLIHTRLTIVWVISVRNYCISFPPKIRRRPYLSRNLSWEVIDFRVCVFPKLTISFLYLICRESERRQAPSRMAEYRVS